MAVPSRHKRRSLARSGRCEHLCHGQFVDCDGIFFEELAEISLAVHLRLLGAEALGEFAANFIEGELVAFTDLKQFKDVPAIGELDGFAYRPLGKTSDALADLRPDLRLGEPAKFSAF